MALQLQNQLTEERIFINSDMDIINYLESKNRVEVKALFGYLTGFKKYDEDVEDDLRGMLRLYGYRLRKQCVDRTVNTGGDNPMRHTFTNTSSQYYSISQYGRTGCYPCGIEETKISRCHHWRKCHYGIDGKCQLACIA